MAEPSDGAIGELLGIEGDGVLTVVQAAELGVTESFFGRNLLNQVIAYSECQPAHIGQ